jgi:hypothetical protein
MLRKGLAGGVLQKETPCNPPKPHCIRSLRVFLIIRAVVVTIGVGYARCVGLNATFLGECSFNENHKKFMRRYIEQSMAKGGYTPG